jgi:hypothetical protein
MKREMAYRSAGLMSNQFSGQFRVGVQLSLTGV